MWSGAASSSAGTQEDGEAGSTGTLRKQMLLRLCSRLLRMLLSPSGASTTGHARVRRCHSDAGSRQQKGSSGLNAELHNTGTQAQLSYAS